MAMSKQRLRREHRAMQGHLDLLRGLLLLTELRFNENNAAKKELAITTVEDRETLSALRALLRTEYMPGDAKARMLFDQFREVDLYVTGPIELYFCVAQAMVERYRRFTAQDETLRHPDLDLYLIANAPAFDAVKNLRDWVLHPGYSRRADEAASILWDENREPASDHAYTIVARLFGLFREVVEDLDELSRRI